MSNSSDEDSFHSASDGEINNDNLNKVDLKSNNEDNETLEKKKFFNKSDDLLNKKNNSTSDFSIKNVLSNKKDELTEKDVKLDDDDDWFKIQMNEYNNANRNQKTNTKNCNVKNLENKSENQKKTDGNKKLWDWTGIHEVVNAVGEGLSNVVEVGLGLPKAEEMAKLTVAERRKLIEEAQHLKEPEPSLSSDEGLGPDCNLRQKRMSKSHQLTLGSHNSLSSGGASPDQVFNSFSNMGSFFTNGSIFSSIVSTPLDMLESLGKKTFETLTVKDENESDKRRFFLRTDNSSQSLSEILRELREEKENLKENNKNFKSLNEIDAERFNTNFVLLFEKNEGLVHLEGLELLSKDQERRTKNLLNSRVFEKALHEFCVEDVSECLTEDFENEFSKYVNFISLPFKPDDVLKINRSLTQELFLRQSAVDANEEIVVDAIHEAAITALAKLTAHSISALHKITQLIIIAQNLPEIESLFAFTYLLCRRFSFFATQYTNILNLVESSDKVDEVVTNIFYECSNACHYVKKALELLRPFFKK